MESPDIFDIIRGAFATYQPAINDEEFYKERFDRSKLLNPSLTEKEFIRSEMKLTTKFLTSGYVDNEYDRLIRIYRAYLKRKPKEFIREYKDRLRKEQETQGGKPKRVESKGDTSQKNDQVFEDEEDSINLIIEDYLYEFKEEQILDDRNYEMLATALKYYFDNGFFPVMTTKIIVRKVNKKRFGWALSKLRKAASHSNEILPAEYLQFAKQNISIFENVEFEINEYQKTNLYKYFTTKTQ